MSDNAKSWYTSRTVLSGISAIAVALYTGLESGLDARSIALGAFGALVIYLRSITSKKLKK